jgi:ribulose-bisphosphate carboxylase large chain
MTVPQQRAVSGLSGRRFSVTYRIRGTREEAETTAQIVANEQTVEFPDEFVPDGDIRDQVMGRIELFEPSDASGSDGAASGSASEPDAPAGSRPPASGEGWYEARISYEEGSAGTDLPQLLNLLSGLTTLLPNLQAKEVTLPAEMEARFRGPRFGIRGLRERLQVWDRPLLCTALKPMGLSSESLATMGYQCAAGGLDIMKDDHGITDLPFAPFRERVPRIADAVARANNETGFNCIYAANVTTGADQIVERARYAQECGAGALMVAPALVGFDTMRMLAEDDSLELPILSHPTFSGGFIGGDPAPFSFYLFYGQMHRLAGADISIFTNWGGRFPVTAADSHGAVAGCREAFGKLRQTLPMVGGGMTIERGTELLQEYGRETAFLVGGRLHAVDEDLTDRVRRFVDTVSRPAANT